MQGKLLGIEGQIAHLMGIYMMFCFDEYINQN